MTRCTENARKRSQARVCGLVTIVLCLLSSGAARAEPIEEDPHLIWAARACYLEATWRESDCIALLWVAQKRAQRVSRPWIDVLRDYSAIEANNERAREVREFPWGDIPGLEGKGDMGVATAAEKLRLLPGFKAELLYSVPKAD